MFKQIIFGLLLISLTFCSMNLKVGHENLLTNKYGQTVIYHGVNVVYKIAPYYPEYDGEWNTTDSFTEKDAQFLQQLGLNNIRLYVAWEGLQPDNENDFDESYLENLMNIVKICEKYDIAVLLDFHQDLYSNFFCGEGLPRWLVESVIPESEQDFPKPLNIELQKDKNGYPLIEDCHKSAFFKYYFSNDVNLISQDLITNVNKLADKMGNFWQKVADHFKNAPNVLGYELINEPWGIDLYKNTLADILPGAQNNKFLLPFYQKLNEYIRKVDEQSLVFYEPITWDFLNSGFETNVGGSEYQKKEVLSYHIYCPLVDSEGQPTSPLICKIFDQFESNGKHKNYNEMGVAGWLTEFGALGNTEGDANELDNLCGNADKIFNSWSYWQYKYYHDITTAAADPDTEGFWNSEGQLQSTKVAALSRAYAYKVCGFPEKMTWNRKTQRFDLKVQVQRGVCNDSRNTEIYLSEYFHYQNGFEAKFKNCNGCSLEKIGDYGYYKVVGDSDVFTGDSWELIVTPKK